jgi:hypothetical protein
VNCPNSDKGRPFDYAQGRRPPRFGVPGKRPAASGDASVLVVGRSKSRAVPCGTPGRRVRSSAMARKVSKETETLARHILQTIYIDTDGQPGQWRMLSGIEGVTASVVMYAVNRGWVELRGNHSICVTEVGRRLVLSHAH